MGGFVTKSHLGWRWTQWLTIIFSLVFLAIYFVFCPETYSPVVLARLAKKRGHTPPGGKVDFKQLARVYMLRPFIMLVQEPILALLTLYMGFIYGFLYLCFEAFPIAFEEHRGWDIGIGSLPFLSITVGVLIGVVIIIVHTMTRMRRKLETVGDAPEERLVPMMIGSIMMPAGIFWFACELFIPAKSRRNAMD